MGETAEAVNNIPAIILLSLWWAFLYMLGAAARLSERTDAPNAVHQASEAGAAGDEHDFHELCDADPEFRAENFLKGARQAYEEILRAYGLCDMKVLQALLSAEVFRAFADAADARSERGETLELTFVGLRSAEIASVEVRPDAIEIAVLFRAELIQAERSSGGEIIRGDPGEVAVVADLWTFARPRPADT